MEKGLLKCEIETVQVLKLITLMLAKERVIFVMSFDGYDQTRYHMAWYFLNGGGDQAI